MSDPDNRTITIFVPAFNEGKNLRHAVDGALNALKKVNPADSEILILNACSSDNTGEIADELAREVSNIKVIHRKSWFGLGANYMEGVKHASMEYFVMFPGDNENSSDSLAEALDRVGEADIIIPYTVNTEARPPHRRIISKCFVMLLNFLFNLRLKYYNGNAVYKTDILKTLHINSQDFAYNAEILTRLIKSGFSYTEIGIKITPTNKTAIFNIRNITGVIKSIIFLFFDVRVVNRSTYNQIGQHVK